MILTKDNILVCQSVGALTITPFHDKFLTPQGYDLHLGRNLLVFAGNLIDPKKDISDLYTHYIIGDHGFRLNPGDLVLGVTVEHTDCGNYWAVMEGTSTNGRMGLESHICAGAGDIGFTGHWTLELRATVPIILYPGMPIGQIVFHTPFGEPGDTYGTGKVSYNNGYSDNPMPMVPNLWKKPEKYFTFK